MNWHHSDVCFTCTLLYLQCLGPCYLLSEKRMTTESKALEKFDELAPQSQYYRIFTCTLLYLQCLGPSYPLSEKRMTTESKALEKFDELAPQYQYYRVFNLYIIIPTVTWSQLSIE